MLCEAVLPLESLFKEAPRTVQNLRGGTGYLRQPLFFRQEERPLLLSPGGLPSWAMAMENAGGIAVMESGQAMVDREELVIIGGHEQWLLTTSVPLRNGAGEVVGLVGIARNITERRQRERELEAISAVSAALRTAQVRSEMVPMVLDERDVGLPQ